MQFAETDGRIAWLRYDLSSKAGASNLSSEVELRFALIPGTMYWGRADGVLVQHGKEVPRQVLQNELNWQSLDAYLEWSVPVPLLAGSFQADDEECSVSLRLVRCDVERPCNAIIVQQRDLVSWVDDASDIRLKRLRWCVERQGRALVIGDPLPPIEGQLLYQDGKVLVQAGYRFDPLVSSDEVRSLVQFERIESIHDQSALLVCLVDEPWTFVPDDQLQMLYRASVRAWAGDIGEAI